MSHLKHIYRNTCLAAMLAVGGSLAFAAEAIPPGAPLGAADPANIATFGMGVDPMTGRPAVQDMLQSQMDEVSARYRDAKQDLEDEYNALVKERDDRRDEIFKQVKAMEEERLARKEKYDRDFAARNQRTADAIAAGDDQRVATERARLEELRNRENRTVDASMDTLRQLYQLDNKRYNELFRIQSAKESLEDARYREERDFAAAGVRLQSAMYREDQPNARRDRLNMALRNHDEQRARMEARYQTQMNALEDLRSLIEDRLAAQRNYLEQYNDIMKDMAEASADESAAGEYARKLNDLEQKRNNEERTYQANVRYIEEKLALEQSSNRDLARLDMAKEAVDARRAEQEANLNRQIEMVDSRLSANNLSDAEKNTLQERKNSLQERLDTAQEANDKVADAIAKRRDLVEEAEESRLDYLQKRNDIRVKMAADSLDADAMEDLRKQVSDLEQERMNREKELRDQAVALDREIPRGMNMRRGGMMRDGTGMARGVEGAGRRMDRAVNRADRMANHLETRMNRQQAMIDRRLESINSRLGEANLSDADKQQYEKMRSDLQAQRQRIQQAYQEGKQRLQERSAADQEYMKKRSEYYAKRDALMRNMNAEDVQYEDMTRYDTELQRLDAQWDAEERQYRESQQPLRNLLPEVDTTDAGQMTDDNWERGVRRAEREAREDFDPAAQRAVEEETGVRGTFRKIGRELSESYHDAINYLTD